MGLASLLRAQCERGGAGDGAGGADHGAGPPLLRFFVAAPLHVGGGVVVRPRRTGDNGSDVVALPRTGRLLLHGRALKTEQQKYKSSSLHGELRETRQHLDSNPHEVVLYLCYYALLPRLSELLPGNEMDGAARLLHGGNQALPALHRVCKWTGSTRRGALPLHLLGLSSQVAVLRVQMARYT